MAEQGESGHGREARRDRPDASPGLGYRQRSTPPPAPLRASRPHATTVVGAGKPAGDPPDSEPLSEPSAQIRVPLSSSGQHLGGVRVALVDVDPTRTDALAVALRERRAEVHVACLTPTRPYWRLLRRFAPHALLVDEGVLAREAKPFLAELRTDPFLRHTQLLPARFDRLFRERTGTASLESIKALLEPLGRAEAYLTTRLNSRCEVEFDLDQLPPHLLLKVLASRSSPTTLTCVRGKETLSWTVAHGRSGAALLRHSSFPAPQRLGSDEALEWLLAHNNCHVVLTQTSDFDEGSGREVIPLVEQQESGLWDLRADGAGAGTSRYRGPGRRATDPPAIVVDSLRAIEVREAEPPASTQAVTASVRAPAVRAPKRRRLSKGALRLGAPAAMVALLLGASAAMLFEPSIESVRSSPAAAPATQASTVPQVPSPVAPPEPLPSAVVPPIAPSPSPAPATEAAELGVVGRAAEDCSVLVGDFEPPRKNAGRAAELHFRRGQKLLVEGENAAAEVELCKAALIDPVGAGAEKLAAFSLGERQFERAEKLATAIVQARPDSVSARELLGDVLHQAGRPEEALALWLPAYQVSSDDVAKRRAVARVWVRHALAEVRAGDYPRAERTLRRALAFDPKTPDGARLMALVFRRRGENSLAEVWERASQ